MTPDRQATIDGLREFADFLEAHPEAKVPKPSEMTVWDTTSGDGSAMIRRRRELGGKWEKEAGEYGFKLVREFGTLRYVIFTTREKVCTARKVTHTKTVLQRDPEAVQAALEAIPEQRCQIEVTETVWVCPDSLLAEAGI